MKQERMTINEFLKYITDRDWTDKSFTASCKDGWYDWFCKDKSLSGKLKRMLPMIKRVAESSKVDKDTMYLFFKNNCPMMGPLYDDFRICSIENGDVLWTITPHEPRGDEGKHSQIWGRENDFDGPILEGTKKDIYTYFGV